MEMPRQTIQLLTSSIIPGLVGCAALVMSFTALSTAVAQEHVPTVGHISVHDDMDKPVTSKIYKFAEDRREFLRDVPNGILENSEIPCPLGTQLVADPVGDHHTNSDVLDCYDKDRLAFKVVSKKVIARLHSHIFNSAESNPAIAAFAYNELGVLAPDPHEIVQTDLKDLKDALVNEDFTTAALIAKELLKPQQYTNQVIGGTIAKSLAVIFAERTFKATGSITFDRAQGMVVMKPSLQNRVSKYQQTKGLKLTGNLDYQTFNSLSGITSADLFYNDYGHLAIRESDYVL